jgi:hypothetical protein
MPDIQTALKSALSRTLQEWDDDDEAPASVSAQPVSTSVSAPSQNIQGIPMTKHIFNVTNNVSRATFDYIKNNPGSTRKEVMAALAHQGYGESSVSSLIAQMRRNKMVHSTNDLYYADIDEYRPIKPIKKLKKVEAPAPAPAPKRKYEKKGTTGIGALLQAKLENAPSYIPDETPPIVPQRKGFVSLVRNRTPESIIDNMTVYQARELYEHLKKLFGG